jgi:hypothetical protein
VGVAYVDGHRASKRVANTEENRILGRFDKPLQPEGCGSCAI